MLNFNIVCEIKKPPKPFDLGGLYKATFMSLVPKAGLEPACREAYAPETYVSTNFTTWALLELRLVRAKALTV